jgi:hypothetical protein
MKAKAAAFSETLVLTYQTTRRNMTKEQYSPCRNIFHVPLGIYHHVMVPSSILFVCLLYPAIGCNYRHRTTGKYTQKCNGRREILEGHYAASGMNPTRS